MNKNIIKTYFFPIAAILFCLSLSIIVSSYVSGPPAMNTNAPGEFTCQGSGGVGCHAGTPNTGSGFAEITIMGGVPAGNFYLPDSSYDMMPYIIDNTKLKGGFQVVAQLSNGLNAGTTTITMPMNTQLISSGGKDYVEQTSMGAVEPSTINMHDWMFNWVAPSAGAGTVTFYIAGIAGDGDGTQAGDNIYTDTLVLYEGTVGINDIDKSLDFSIEKTYPLPAKDFVIIDFETSKNIELFINVVGINGKIVISEKSIEISPTNRSYKLNLAELNGGIYFVNINQVGKPGLQQKIIKFN